MTIPNDIQQLLDRYLDGLTSLEEEDRLADYLRSHDVPEPWQPYKEMFAYFDAGMPTEESGKEEKEEVAMVAQPKAETTRPRPRRHRTVALWTGLSVAAAAALTLIILHPIANRQSAAVTPAAPIAAVTEMPADTTNRAQRDTVKTEPAAKPVRKRPVHRYRDTPAKPHTYYASLHDANEVPQPTPADEYLIEARLRQIEQEQARSIEEALARQENLIRQAEIQQAQKKWEMAQAANDEEVFIEEYP